MKHLTAAAFIAATTVSSASAWEQHYYAPDEVYGLSEALGSAALAQLVKVHCQEEGSGPNTLRGFYHQISSMDGQSDYFDPKYGDMVVEFIAYAVPEADYWSDTPVVGELVMEARLVGPVIVYSDDMAISALDWLSVVNIIRGVYEMGQEDLFDQPNFCNWYQDWNPDTLIALSRANSLSYEYKSDLLSSWTNPNGYLPTPAGAQELSGAYERASIIQVLRESGNLDTEVLEKMTSMMKGMGE